MDYLYIDQSKQKPESLRPYDFHQIYLFVSKHQSELIDPKIYGWIQVSNMYLSEQDFFRVNYGEEDLIIENTGEYYIPFEDPLTCKMAANIWGDTVGVTESRATLYNGVELTRAKTAQYDQITTFDEFKYFNKLNQIPKQAFYAFHNLTHINCPPSLKTVGEQAFYQCDKLSSFGNLSNLESIGPSAFRDTLLSEFSSDNIKTINNNCFRNTQLTTCHIDGTFTTLPSDTFRYCILLESVTGMSNVTVIESEAFYDCQVLKNVPTENVTEIKASAFYNCRELETLNTPNLRIIRNSAFKNCVSLKTLDTSNVTTIEQDGFGVTSSLEDLDLSNVTTLGVAVFYESGIKHISLPSLQTGIGSLGAFIKTSQVETVEFNEESTGWTTPYIIPTQFAYNASKLTSINVGNCYQINQEAFRGCSSLISIGEQPEEPILVKLQNSCFYGCVNLDHIDISLVSEIPASGFLGCKHLKSLGNNNVLTNVEYLRGSAFKDFGTSGEAGLGEISFPNCTLIESQVFYNCYGITKINFSDSLTEIRSEAFRYCKDLEYVTGLDNVTLCNWGVFYGCTSLKEISFPNLTQFIGGSSQFEGCTGLISVNLPKLTALGGKRAFNGCRIDGLLNLPLIEDLVAAETTSGAKIKRINLHNCTKLYAYQFDNNTLLEEIDLTSCTTVGRNAFNGCTALTHIELPSISGSIPMYTLRNCSSLETITFGDNEIVLENESLRDNPELKTINLNHCTRIGWRALTNCPKLESIGSFSNSLTFIGANNFEGSRLTGDITIPASVTEIGDYAFYNCGQITSIIMQSETPPKLGIDVFTGALSYPIYVPASAVDTYKAASRWSGYKTRIFAAS